MSEAQITINGIPLTDAQSCTIRVTIANFLMQLADPEFCEDLGEIADGYRARASEVQSLIFRAFKP